MTSPFKFLDPYGPPDQAIFFGRTEEIDQLYGLIFQTDLLLVYGASGTGKTSLVQCGLAGRFRPTDRFELLVRRNQNLNASLDREIRKRADTPIPEGAPLVDAVQSLYLDYLRPVHLIFDQFEELFLLGSPDEQRVFIDSIAALLLNPPACKVVIVMREEFIAALSEFEKKVPKLFSKRFRVEPMSQQNVTRVITGTTKHFNITLEQGETTAQEIIENLSDHRAGVQLSYLQVYLDKLYRQAVQARSSQSDSAAPIVFTKQLVRQTGKLDDVLASFLEEQTTAITQTLKAIKPKVPADAVQVILEKFTTLEGTKDPLTHAELAELRTRPGLAEAVDPCLKALINSRVVRQTDEAYELSHDALARRIADNRSAENKMLLKVQKIVKDRISAYEQTKTLLSKEELGLVAPHLAKLSLDENDTRFVTKSQQMVRRRWQYGLAATVLLVLGLSVGLWVVRQQREKATRAIDEGLKVAVDLLSIGERVSLLTGEDTPEVRKALLDATKALNTRLDPDGTDRETANLIAFWTEKNSGDLQMDNGEVDEARKHYETAMEKAQSLVKDAPDDPDYKRLLGIGESSFGDLESEQQNIDQARARYSAAIDNGQQLMSSTGDEHRPILQRDLVHYHTRLGGLEFQAKQFEAGRKAYGDAIAIAREMETEQSTERDLELSVLYSALGTLEFDAGNLDAGRQAFTANIAASERLAAAEPNEGEWQEILAIAYRQLGHVEEAVGERVAARAWYTKAVEVSERLIQAQPDEARWKVLGADMRAALAAVGTPTRR